MELATWLQLQLLAVIAILLYRLHRYFCGNFHIFRAQGIPGPRPIPIFGTWFGSWRHNPHELALTHYKQYGKIYCTFRGRSPVLHVHDPELFHSMCTKDLFEHFDRRFRRPVTGESANINSTMSMLYGEKWKVMRGLVMTAFLPQVIRQRVDFANESVQEFVEEWRRIAVEAGRMDLRDEAEMLCAEVMMNYIVGRKLGTLGDPSHPFVLNARKAMETGERSFVGTVTQIYPKLVQWLCPVLDTGNEYLVGLSKEILKERLENTGEKATAHHVSSLETDLVDRLLDCLNGNNVKGHEYIDEASAVAQITSSILTGYDIGTVVTRILHCLAVYPEAQDRCRVEIRGSLEKHGGQISFAMLNELPYVEQCAKEALRLYPTTAMLNRLCTKEKQYPGLFIPAGTAIECPIYTIQRDSDFCGPNALIFNPDRFNADNTDPLVFLPFGQGPRACFAQKFSMIFLKHCLAPLLANFDFFPVQETVDPIPMCTGPSGVLTARDMFVGIKLLEFP